MRKGLLTGIVGILIAILAYVVFSRASFNTFVKHAIIKQAMTITGQKVYLEKVDIKPNARKGLLTGFTIANPKGYKAPYALSIETIAIDFVPELAKPYTIDTLHIKGLKIFAQVKKTGESNILQLLRAMKDYKYMLENIKRHKETDHSHKTKADVKVKIRKIILSDITLNLNLEVLGQKTYHYVLPELRLQKIGTMSTDNGIYVSEVGMLLFKKIAEATVDKFTSILIKHLDTIGGNIFKKFFQ